MIRDDRDRPRAWLFFLLEKVPAAGEGHDTASVFVVVRAMVSNGPALEYLIVTAPPATPVTKTLPLLSTATAVASPFRP